MNFLAHAVLSFNDPEILVGNMISDFVKGKNKFNYSEGIQKGIQLHRLIDTFTDEHPATKRVKSVFAPHYRLYASPISDIVFDYFVANDAELFLSQSHLQEFAQHTYRVLDAHHVLFPEPFHSMFPYMKQQNWLYHYSEDWGVMKGLQGLERRALYMDSADKAFDLFKENKPLIREVYDEFFALLKLYASEQLALLNNR
ncbi:MAG TPA: ACP phosphodiesterase [Ferruginibacter sp.]|nr:ACP phosphodiesterase [Ferruginibacter sp.]HRO06977.1 ACP phosphodiesterase [Ferruginibacter sp.]HRO95417.1 ACP phosphodiesterase [Ferruginibacter sp.]HRP50507.1 ACP phosphodiesterase [Ferruginibacter sp.]